MTTPAGMPKCTSLQEGGIQLLPGIPDEITFGHIVGKLPWEAFLTLSSVSRGWLHVIRSRQVYDARVLSRSTETVALARFFRSSEKHHTTVGLCSLSDDPMRSKAKYAHIHPACTGLPPIPYVGGQWICSNGYIYLVAAEEKYLSRDCSNKVFVFDVAGQRKWKECASMNERRRKFGCGVMHGKLYVFGGLSSDVTRYALNADKFCGSEVYDPTEDRWSMISPMTTLQFEHKVETVGDELFVHGGWVFTRDPRSEEEYAPRFDDGDRTRLARFSEVYHPVRDEWRIVHSLRREGYLFSACGRLYLIDWSSVSVYGEGSSWMLLHTFSFPSSWPADSFNGEVYTAIIVEGELLVKAAWWRDDRVRRFGEFQSKGFGSLSDEITWQKAPQFEIHAATYPESSNQLLHL